MLFFFIYVLCSYLNLFSIFVIVFEFFRISLSRILGLSFAQPLTAFVSFFIYIGILIFIFWGFLPFRYMVLSSPWLILFFSTTAWLMSLLYLLSSKRLSLILVTSGSSLLISFILLVVEVLGLLMKPLSLSIRLYANLTFGYYSLYYLSVFLNRLGFYVFFFSLPLMLFELCVFLIQSFVFTYLVLIYFEE